MTQVEKAKTAISNVRVRPMSTQVAEVRQNINLIQEAMKATMKRDVHFGVIPGCQKPSLYKPGAEVIIALFKLSTDPIVTDLSKDHEIRYQVKVNITTREKVFVGSGIGECSSGEEKYSWRAAICQEEFEATLETMRRIKFKKNYNGPVLQIQQVRVSPSDMANTILKMAKKRALIDAVLTATGASDIFSQDIEELPEGYIPEPLGNGQETAQPQAEQSIPVEQPNGNVISEPQRKRLYAIAMGTMKEQTIFKEWLSTKFGYQSSKDIDRGEYDKICKAAEEYRNS